MRQISGYVRTTFERKVGMSMLDWLVEHGGGMTCAEAARHIGYARAHALDGIVRAHLPGFRFHKHPCLYTDAVISKALDLRAAGKQWAEVAAECGPSIKRACRRYKVRLSKQPPRPDVSCTAKKRVG